MSEERKLTPEQERYRASFAEAMRALEAEYKRQGTEGKAYRELKRKGMWDPDFITMSYVVVVGKLSPLSKRLRDYILYIGELAHQIYDKATEVAEKKQTEDAKGGNTE